MPLSSLTALTTESQAWLILSGLCGILLLLVGGAVIRMGVALTGLVLGTLAGWMIWASLEIPVPSWLMMALGAIVFLCFALLLARFVTALMLGMILAIWLIGLVLTWTVFDPKLDSPIKPLPTWMASAISLDQDPDIEHSSDEMDSEHAGIAMHESLVSSWKEAQETWAAIPPVYHLVIGLAAAAGLALGLLSGLFFHRTALLLMTCSWGGLLVLISGIGLAGGNARDGPWQSSVAMMIAWTALSAFGWALQRSLQGRQSSDET